MGAWTERVKCSVHIGIYERVSWKISFITKLLPSQNKVDYYYYYYYYYQSRESSLIPKILIPGFMSRFFFVFCFFFVVVVSVIVKFKIKDISYFSTKTHVAGTHKKRLAEALLLSIHNIK